MVLKLIPAGSIPYPEEINEKLIEYEEDYEWVDD